MVEDKHPPQCKMCYNNLMWMLLCYTNIQTQLVFVYLYNTFKEVDNKLVWTLIFEVDYHWQLIVLHIYY